VTAEGFAAAHQRVDVLDGGPRCVSVVLRVGAGNLACTICPPPPPNELVIPSELDSHLDSFPTLGRPVFASRVRKELKRIKG
jgi:hypothetical protein